jgi:hypothetical protein
MQLFQQTDPHTHDYNAWLQTIRSDVKELIFMFTLQYRKRWGKDWKKHFSVDLVNGITDDELKYLRVGLRSDHS